MSAETGKYSVDIQRVKNKLNFFWAGGVVFFNDLHILLYSLVLIV